MEAGAIKGVSYIGIQGWYAESRNEGYLFEGPRNEDYNILKSMLGSAYLWKLPCFKGQVPK